MSKQTAAVVALGKIGLPLAVQIAGAGVQVLGSDISPLVVDLVNRGEEPFPGEAHLAERLGRVVADGMLRATTDNREAVAAAGVVIVVVPLMVDGDGVPNFAAIDAATADIGAALQPRTLVSYETTLPVGTTRNRFAPMLAAASGLEPGKDFFLVHSPERVFSGRIFADLRRYPKLVGGIDQDSSDVAVAFYERVLEFDDRPDLHRPNGVWDLGSAEAAEMAKLAETTYRDVNIALANEFARFAEEIGIDVGPVIEAANSQPFSHIHRPGVAVGGHCIPVYPRFYTSVDAAARIPTVAREVNESVPARVVGSVSAALGGLKDATVAVLGAAYRGGVKETAFSGVFPLVDAIEAHGGTALVHDPLYTDDELIALRLQPFHLGDPAEAAIVQADHDEYRSLVPADVAKCRVLYDGRRIVALDPWLEAGVEVLRIGSG